MIEPVSGDVLLLYLLFLKAWHLFLCISLAFW